MHTQLLRPAPGLGLVTRILATVTPWGPGSRLSIQVVIPRTTSRCGLITTSPSSADSTSWSSVVPSARAIGDQLVEGDPPVARLDPAQGGRAQVTAGRQVIQGPAACGAQAPDPLADQAVQFGVLRHRQDAMSFTQGTRTVD